MPLILLTLIFRVSVSFYPFFIFLKMHLCMVLFFQWCPCPVSLSTLCSVLGGHFGCWNRRDMGTTDDSCFLVVFFLPGLEEPCSLLLVCCQWCMLVCGGCSELVLYVHLEISKLLILLLRYVQWERLTSCALASHTHRHTVSRPWKLHCHCQGMRVNANRFWVSYEQDGLPVNCSVEGKLAVELYILLLFN